MTSRKGRKAWAGEIPVEVRSALKDEAKESGLPQWKIVSQALRMYLGIDEGSTEAALERQLEELQDEIDEIDREQDRLEDQRDEREERMELLEEQLEDLREKRSSYKEQLDEILDSLVENPNTMVLGYMSDIRDAAIVEYGRATDDNIDRVIADLRGRRDDRDIEIADSRFARTGRNVTVNSATADGGKETADWSVLKDGEVEVDE